MKSKVDSHAWESFIEESAAVEDEATALTTGLLLSMVIRQVLVGRFVHLHSVPRHSESFRLWLMAASCILLATLVVASRVLFEKHASKKMRPEVERLIDLMVQTMSMTMGFLFRFVGKCMFFSYFNGGDDGSYVLQSKMEESSALALTFSAIVLFLVRVVDYLADHLSKTLGGGFRQLNFTFALLMGLAWEETFEEAIISIAGVHPVPQSTFMYGGFSLGVDVLVLPAWALYILPQVKGTKATHHRPSLTKSPAGRDVCVGGDQHGPPMFNVELVTRQSAG